MKIDTIKLLIRLGHNITYRPYKDSRGKNRVYILSIDDVEYTTAWKSQSAALKKLEELL